jgi:hypothetical protein
VSKRMAWRRISIVGIACALANCEGDRVSQTDVMGEFHANVPSGQATLVIKPDYSWKYHIDGQRDFIRSGKWEPEPSLTTSSVYTITFIRFEFGFPGYEFEAFWAAQFSRDYTGKVRACIMDDRICFRHS